MILKVVVWIRICKIEYHSALPVSRLRRESHRREHQSQIIASFRDKMVEEVAIENTHWAQDMMVEKLAMKAFRRELRKFELKIFITLIRACIARID